MEVHQGSAIAPLLVSIMLHYLEEVIKEETLLIHKLKGYKLNIALCADDLAVWTDIAQTNTKKRSRYFQKCMNIINIYMKETGFQLSTEKTIFMVFSPKTRNTKNVHLITIDDQIIKPADRVKFLGATIRKNLSWTTHIRNLITKAEQLLGQSNSLVENHGPRPKICSNWQVRSSAPD